MGICVCVCVRARTHTRMHAALPCPTLCNPMDNTAHLGLLSVEFSRQKNCNGLPFPTPGFLPDPGVELACQFFTTKPQGKPLIWDKSEVKVAQLCLTLCDLMDYIVHGILQAGIMEWVAFPFFKGIFPTHPPLLLGRQILYH